MAHNVSGFENQLIISKNAEKLKECDFSCFGKNTEKYIFFSLKNKI